MNYTVVISFSFLILNSLSVSAQGLSTIYDYKNYFFTFNKGVFSEEDRQQVQSFKIGGNSVVFVDNFGLLKTNYNGKTITLSDTPVNDYKVSDNLIAFSLNNTLNVFDSGIEKNLSLNCESYDLNDSLMLFFEHYTHYLTKVYYKGKTKTIGESVNTPPIISHKVGSNIIAYFNDIYQFNIFYRDTVVYIETSNNIFPYETGRNIVAYVNRENNFNAFHNGKISHLESVAPLSFHIGDDLVAYTTLNNDFKVFYNGKTTELSPFIPSFYEVKDSIVLYNDRNLFKVFYNNKIYTLENYIPTIYKMDNNTVAYIDNQGKVKVFYHGKNETTTIPNINTFELNRDVINYSFQNKNYIYYNSKIYSK